MTTTRIPWRNRATRFAETVTTPLLPADYLDLFAPLRSGAALRGRIEEVHPETADAATIVIRPGADWAGHTPGQFVRIGIDVDGVRLWRAYSLTHGPRTDGRISITVKAVPEGVVSNHLVHASRPGTLVHLEQAAGEFVLPADGGKLLFVTAGSGITPVIGMLRNLFPVTDSGVVRLPRSDAFDITVVHVAPTEPDSIFLDDLRALADVGAIELLARYDDVHGVLDVADLSALVPDVDARISYACGPAGLLDALADHHERRGLDLFTEQFRSTNRVVGTAALDHGLPDRVELAAELLDVLGGEVGDRVGGLLLDRGHGDSFGSGPGFRAGIRCRGGRVRRPRRCRSGSSRRRRVQRW